jgi:ribose 5-phosphate isomerase B
MANTPIGIACDHAALELKQLLSDELGKRGLTVRDFGTNARDSVDYPDFAHALATAIAAGEITRGILLCGTGVGMSLAANRHPEVRAVVCSEPLSARMSRRHNDANVLCLGARVVGPDTAVDILTAFLEAEFEGGRHARRVAKINLP